MEDCSSIRCSYGRHGCVILIRKSLCTVTLCLQSRGAGQDTLPFFSKVSRLKLPQEVTFVLQWTSALIGDISGCDSWGLLLTSSGWRSRVPLNVLTLQNGKVPPAWYQKQMQIQVPALSRWRRIAWDWRPHGQVCSQGSLDGSRITSQMVCTGLRMHSLPSVCCRPAGLQWKNTFLC